MKVEKDLDNIVNGVILGALASLAAEYKHQAMGIDRKHLDEQAYWFIERMSKTEKEKQGYIKTYEEMKR